MSSFKIFFSDETIRRFRCDTFPSFDEFVRLMVNLYPNAYHPEMKLQYVDSEGDKCTITTDIEWKEMRQELGEQAVFRVWVMEGEKEAYFKDGPEPELVKIYSDPVTKTPQNPSIFNGLEERVTQALANLFPGGKILPNNMPAFLDGTITLKTRDDKSVDLDVDIAYLASRLHKRAYELLSNVSKPSVLSEAKDCLISLLTLSPENPVAYYNLACAESLLGNVDAALDGLSKSVQFGYADVDHMTTDPDLKNVFDDPRFEALVTSMRAPAPEPEIKEPEPEIKEPEPEVKVPEPEVKVPEPEPEVKVPEPEPVPVEPEQPKKKWGSQLQVLAEMGFLDESILVMTLDKTNGDVNQALTDLLG